MLHQAVGWARKFRRGAIIDSRITRLHYIWTMLLLKICAILTWTGGQLGSSISCLGPKHLDPGFVNKLCWIKSSYTIHLPGKEKSKFLWQSC